MKTAKPTKEAIQAAYAFQAPVRRRERPRHVKTFQGPTRTKQAHLGECDINQIMARYERFGVIDHVNRHQGRYADITGLGDYQDCLNQVREAQELFADLPAAVRRRFDNDPQAFLDFCADPSNLDEMRTLGLLAEAPLPADASPDGTASAEAPPAPSSSSDKT